MYLMNYTRPDIAYSVSKLSRYTSNPSNQHWDALLRVLGYLKRTREYSLCYRKYPSVIEGYSDVNWISDTDESICIHCDNQATIAMAKSFVYNGKSRHIRRRHNTVRLAVAKKLGSSARKKP